jgi:hypothetical protein
MTKQITIEIKDVFGKLKFYPYCKDSKIFAAIAGTTTLTETNLRRILELGYEIATHEARYTLPETLRREK